MQTFLPYPNSQSSSKALDTKRLGKQRVETLQLVRCNLGYTTGWVNHPAAVMWRNHTNALIAYGLEICLEWTSRGFKDTVFDKLLLLSSVPYVELATVPMPKWFGNEAFHASHRANLLRKDRAYYSKFGWTEDSWLDYVWPGEG